MLRYRYSITAIALLIMVLTTRVVAAQVVHPSQVITPSIMHYQARLLDNMGKPVDGKVAVKVFIYDEATGGVAGDLNDTHLLYAEKHANSVVSRGLLQVAIGGGEPLGRFAGAPLPIKSLAVSKGLYLELYVQDERMTPRQKINYVPSATIAEYASVATNVLGSLSVSSSNFPKDYSAANITKGVIDQQRIPTILSDHLSGTQSDVKLTASNMPAKIPISKLKTQDPISADRLPNVGAARIQSGTFPNSVVPANVATSGDIEVIGGYAMDGQAVSLESTNGNSCSCMLALHSNELNGAEGMNTAEVSWNASGKTMECDMRFEGADGLWEKKTTTFCNYTSLTFDQLNAAGVDPDQLKNSSCSQDCPALCDIPAVCSSIANPITNQPCRPDQVALCKASCVSGCNSCFYRGNYRPCNGSYLCVCTK